MLLIFGTLSGEVFIQFFFHVVGHMSCNRTANGICHSIQESGDKVDIPQGLGSTHDCLCVITVVDGGSVGR